MQYALIYTPFIWYARKYFEKLHKISNLLYFRFVTNKNKQTALSEKELSSSGKAVQKSSETQVLHVAAMARLVRLSQACASPLVTLLVIFTHVTNQSPASDVMAHDRMTSNGRRVVRQIPSVAEQQLYVDLHNNFRREAGASNMREVVRHSMHSQPSQRRH